MKGYVLLLAISLLMASFMAVVKLVVGDEPPAANSSHIEGANLSYQPKWSFPQLVQRPIRDYGLINSINVAKQ